MGNKIGLFLEQFLIIIGQTVFCAEVSYNIKVPVMLLILKLLYFCCQFFLDLLQFYIRVCDLVYASLRPLVGKMFLRIIVFFSQMTKGFILLTKKFRSQDFFLITVLVVYANSLAIAICAPAITDFLVHLSGVLLGHSIAEGYS